VWTSYFRGLWQIEYVCSFGLCLWPRPWHSRPFDITGGVLWSVCRLFEITARVNYRWSVWYKRYGVSNIGHILFKIPRRSREPNRQTSFMPYRPLKQSFWCILTMWQRGFCIGYVRPGSIFRGRVPIIPLQIWRWRTDLHISSRHTFKYIIHFSCRCSLDW